MAEKEKNRSGILIFMSILLVLSICALVFFFKFRRENTEVRYIGDFPEGFDIEDSFNRKTDSYTYLLALRNSLFGMDEVPFVEKVDIEITDRNSCSVCVYGKTLTGCIEVMQDYLYFDREGMVSECLGERIDTIPLVSGFDPKEAVVGRKIDFPDSLMPGTVSDLYMLFSKNGITGVEIMFNTHGEVTLKIGDDEVWLGKADAYDEKINNLPGILRSVGEGSFLFDMRRYDSSSGEVTARVLH